MNGPSAQAFREGGTGGSFRYKNGTTLVVRIADGQPVPPEWKRKTTLQEVFADYGQVLKIDLPQGQGMAYIEYEDRRDAEDAARDMNGKKVCGRPVNVQIATASNTTVSGGRSCGTQERVVEMSRMYGLDEAATARLVSVFAERLRLGCDINVDIEQLSAHLACSNKPSALVSMKLAEFRSGKPIGPCKFSMPKPERGPRPDRGTHENGEDDQGRSRDREPKDRKDGDRDAREHQESSRERRGGSEKKKGSSRSRNPDAEEKRKRSRSETKKKSSEETKKSTKEKKDRSRSRRRSSKDKNRSSKEKKHRSRSRSRSSTGKNKSKKEKKDSSSKGKTKSSKEKKASASSRSRSRSTKQKKKPSKEKKDSSSCSQSSEAKKKSSKEKKDRSRSRRRSSEKKKKDCSRSRPGRRK